MAHADKKTSQAYTFKVIRDLPKIVIGKSKAGDDLTLREYYADLTDDKAEDRVRDVIRRLIQARVNEKPASSIDDWRESLEEAFIAGEKWGNSRALRPEYFASAANVIDEAIVASITKHELIRISNGQSHG